MDRLAIVISHPVQYYSPLFTKLALYCELKVFYTFGDIGGDLRFDEGFRKRIKWDIPLLDGYDYVFLENNSKKPSLNSFLGIKNDQLIPEVSSFNPKAILVYGWAYYSHFKLMRHFKGNTRVWFRGDSTLLDKSSHLKLILRKLMLTWVYHHIDLAFYVGSENKSYFEAFGLRESQMVFAPHAVDNNRFAKDSSEETEIFRQTLGISKNHIIILFAGKLEEKKNPEILIDAFIASKLDKAHLLFVGNGDLESMLKEKASANNSKMSDSKKIHFIDFKNQSQMPGIFQLCDVFCLPSKGPAETWGLAVNEAMASAKAIICSDKVGCSKDLISQNKNGWIFSSGDLSALTTIINKLDKQSLFNMGTNSKEKINRWNYEITIQNIFKALKNV